MADVVPWTFAIGFVVLLFGIAWDNTRKQIAATLERRPNLTRAEFCELMVLDVSRPTAEFVWDKMIGDLEPKLAPHPDDDLAKDLPIDDEEWSMDWPSEFAGRHGFSENDLPDWPEGWRATVRNYGRWLEMGLARASAS